MTSQVLLYSGYGTAPWLVDQSKSTLEKFCDKNHYVVKTFETSIPDLKDVSLLVVPGGSALQINAGPLGKEFSKIHEYCCRSNGRFLGFCAGSLLPSRKCYLISYSSSKPLAEAIEISMEKDGLTFFEDLAVPFPQPEMLAVPNYKEVKVQWNVSDMTLNQPFSSFYSRGPWFLNPREGEVLMRYESMPIDVKFQDNAELYESPKPIAAVLTHPTTFLSSTQGKAIGCGFHPEIHPDGLDVLKTKSIFPDHTANLKKKLMESLSQNQNTVVEFLKKLDIKTTDIKV